MSKPVALAKDVLTADLASRIEQVFGKSTDSLDLVERRARELLPEHKVVIWEGDPQTFQFGF
ncbi:MAG: hypothetical protein Q8N52_06215, partial [Acidobacteriota bacterium]|nr:hypothetical protein [Acidobacteriota bacterium]